MALEESECADAGVEKPDEEEDCPPPEGAESCNVPGWVVSDWTGCEEKCGEY